LEKPKKFLTQILDFTKNNISTIKDYGSIKRKYQYLLIPQTSKT